MDALTPHAAELLVKAWEADPAHAPACEFYRPGRFDLRFGEHRCPRCHVPESIHRAYRLLNRTVLTHG